MKNSAPDSLDLRRFVVNYQDLILLAPEQIATYQAGDFPKWSAEENGNSDVLPQLEEPPTEATNFCQV